jgi:hypothetical protein
MWPNVSLSLPQCPACHLSLFWARLIHSMPLSHFPSSILILSPHLRLYFANGLFHSGFRTKTPYTGFLFPTRATWQAFFVLLFLVTRIIFGEQYTSLSSSYYYCLHTPVTSSLVGSNILLNTFFSKTLSILFSRNISDHVLHPYIIQAKL